MGAMTYPSLFSDLPLMPKPIAMMNGVAVESHHHRQSKAEREAEKKKFAEMQFDLFMQLLVKPLIKSMRNSAGVATKRMLDTWEDAKVFAGSVTITDRPRLTSIPVQMDWSNEVLLEMHRWVFDEALEALKCDDNPEEKLDVLEWIFSPAYIDKIGKSMDGRPCIIRRHASDIPFSFENCHRAMGYTDPDTFREDLVEKMNEELKPRLRKYLTTYTGKRF